MTGNYEDGYVAQRVLSKRESRTIHIKGLCPKGVESGYNGILDKIKQDIALVTTRLSASKPQDYKT